MGEIQSSPYGHRVCLTLGIKQYYGPYRATIDCAKADLAKLHSEEVISVRKKRVVLLALKSDVRLRRDVGCVQSSLYAIGYV